MLTENEKPDTDLVLHMWKCGKPDSSKPAAGYSFLGRATHIEVFHATMQSGGYNHHAQLAWHGGKFHAMWSNHAHGEDGPGQRVLYSYSEDAARWQPFTEMFPSPQEVKSSEEDGLVLTAHKWVKLDGRLFAVAGLHKNEGFCDPNGNGHSEKRDKKNSIRRRIGYSILAREVRSDGERSPVFALRHNLPKDIRLEITLPTHASFANLAQDLSKYYGSPDCMPAWDFEKTLDLPKAMDGHRLCEPTVYRTPDDRYLMLLRDTRYFHRIFVSTSLNGRQWKPARPTDIPDSPSLSTTVVLSDGTVLLIGNQMAPDFDNPERGHYSRDPLTVAVSTNGYIFSKAFALRTGVQEFRVPNVKGRGGGGQYPSVLVHEDMLYVLYSMGKEDIWISSVALSDLGININGE